MASPKPPAPARTHQDIEREVIRLLRNNGHKAYRPKDMARELGYSDNKTYRQFSEVLSGLDERGLVSQAKGGRFAYKRAPTRMEGILRVTRQGFGFVQVEGVEEDLYVRESDMGTALDGDLVQVGLTAPAAGDRRRECEVLEVLERRRNKVVGTFKKVGRFAAVVPDDRRVGQDVYIPADDTGGAQDGDKVVASIDRWEDRKASPEGRVLEVIGRADDSAVRVLALAMSMDVRAGFPDDVLAEAEAIPEEPPADEVRRRLDLRSKRIFTIDPVDANDFDDAVHIEALPDGHFELGVHIADVSAYVPEGSALDREAYERATSVYLVDRVIPMLPEKLSNRVCSLRPHEDKLAYSCIMNVSPKGKVAACRIEETVIRSVYRFTYEEAQEVIEGRAPGHALAPDLERAAGLARTLTARRMEEGSVDFDLPEVKVELDDDGTPVRVYRKQRQASNRLIEEFMLLANRTVTEDAATRRGGLPFVYRIHDLPDAERIQRLADYVRAFGYKVEVREGKITSQALNKLVTEIKGKPEETVIEDAALRSMAKARYSTNNIGHYGLSFPHYSHFTSPIRRYPDLMVHRLLKRYLAGGGPADVEALETRCAHCSGKEKAAAEAERESVKLKLVEYISNHVGETFDGVVSGVTKYGIYIEITELLVEGMVHVRDLDDDYYEYDERTYRLIGRHTGATFRLGDPHRVTVAAANVETREVDLALADKPERAESKGGGAGRGRRGPERKRRG